MSLIGQNSGTGSYLAWLRTKLLRETPGEASPSRLAVGLSTNGVEEDPGECSCGILTYCESLGAGSLTGGTEQGRNRRGGIALGKRGVARNATTGMARWNAAGAAMGHAR